MENTIYDSFLLPEEIELKRLSEAGLNAAEAGEKIRKLFEVGLTIDELKERAMRAANMKKI